jgi:hypothetical protein
MLAWDASLLLVSNPWRPLLRLSTAVILSRVFALFVDAQVARNNICELGGASNPARDEPARLRQDLLIRHFYIPRAC